MLAAFVLVSLAAVFYYLPWLLRGIANFMYQYPYMRKLPGKTIFVMNEQSFYLQVLKAFHLLAQLWTSPEIQQVLFDIIFMK